MNKTEEELILLEKLVRRLIIRIEKNEDVLAEIESDPALKKAYDKLSDYMNVE